MIRQMKGSAVGMVGLLVLATSAVALAHGHSDKIPKPRPGVTTLYVTRHADDMVQQVSTGPGTYKDDCDENACCIERLNPLGTERAADLAGYFKASGIDGYVDMVIATHKYRTVQTVVQIAHDAGLDGTNDSFSDQNPGDGVRQVPSFPGECDDGFQGSNSPLAAQLDYIQNLPQGTVAVVASHSTTIYPIFNALGIDTSDETVFPIKHSNGHIPNFNNLWVVEIDRNGHGTLRAHLVLDLKTFKSDEQSFNVRGN